MGGMVQGDLDRQNGKDDDHHDPHQQGAEVAQAALEFRFRRPQGERIGDLAKLGGPSGLHDQGGTGTTANRCPGEDTVGAFDQTGAFWRNTRLFFHGIGLAGQQRLAHVEILCLDQDAVTGNQAAGHEQHEVAGHHLFGGDGQALAVPQHDGFERNPFAQFLQDLVGSVFLNATQHRGDEHNAHHDQGIQPVVHDEGDEGGKDQDQHQGAAESLQEEARELE